MTTRRSRLGLPSMFALFATASLLIVTSYAVGKILSGPQVTDVTGVAVDTVLVLIVILAGWASLTSLAGIQLAKCILTIVPLPLAVYGIRLFFSLSKSLGELAGQTVFVAVLVFGLPLSQPASDILGVLLCAADSRGFERLTASSIESHGWALKERPLPLFRPLRRWDGIYSTVRITARNMWRIVMEHLEEISIEEFHDELNEEEAERSWAQLSATAAGERESRARRLRAVRRSAQKSAGRLTPQ